MKKIFSLFAAVLFAGAMFADPVEIYKNEGTNETINGITAQGNVNTNEKNGNPGNSFANTSSSNTTFTFAGFDVTTYSNLKLSVDAKFGSFPSTTETWPYLEVVFYKGEAEVQKDEATVAWSAKNNAYATYVISITKDFDKIVCIGHPAEGKSGKGNPTTNYAIYFDNFTVTGEGAAPAVAKPAIAGDAEFFDEVEVSITCETEGAKIYYTLDGTEPAATSTEYTAAFKLTETKTVKAIAIKGEDKSKIAEKTFTAKPSYASVEALVEADLASGTLVKVAFENVKIDSIFVAKSSSKRQGIFLNAKDKTGLKDVEIYYSTEEVPAEWAAGGSVSGAIIGTWTYYEKNAQWEIVPQSGFKWADLTYKAGSATAIDNTELEGKAVKAIENGQLVIIKNGVRYNALGNVIR